MNGSGDDHGVPEVTVLISTNRIDEWLRDALRSLFESFGVRFRVVLVFDGVTDADLSEFTEDPRLTCLALDENVGVGGALYRGMKIVETEFVARLDGDDLVHPTRIATQLAFLKEHPTVVSVSCQMTYVDERGEVTAQSSLPSGIDVRHELLGANIVPGPASMFRRRSYFESGEFNPGMRKMEDYDLWLRMSLLGPIAIIDEPLYFYRRSSTSLSTTIRPWESYVRTVVRNKRRLAKKLDVSRAERHAAVYGWLWLQWRAYLDRKIERLIRRRAK